MTRLEHSVRDLLIEQTPAAPGELSGPHLRNLAAHPTRSTLVVRIVPVLATTGVLVVLIALGAMLFRLGSGSRTTVAPRAGGSHTVQGDPHRTAAQAEIDRLITLVPSLPGAHVAGVAPTVALQHPFEQVSSDNLVQTTKWWTAPGSVDDAIDYLKSHVPVSLSGTGSASGVDFQALVWGSTGTDAISNPQVLIEVVEHDGGVAIRADAQAVWIPSKPAIALLPAHPVSIEVTVVGPLPEHQQVGHGTLTSADAARVVQSINALPVVTPGRYSCPRDTGEHDTLRFTDAGHAYLVDVAVTGCAGVTITVDGTKAATLQGSIDPLLRGLLHLSPR
ncbi:MAG: hypothetical protein ACR2KJ_04445 [Jatrophihabitans sp.]